MSSEKEKDEVEASRAPLLSHLIELRGRLVKSAAAMLLSMVLCFYFAKDIYNILVWPYDLAIRQLTGHHAVLIYTAPQEFLVSQIVIAFYGGLFLSFPIIAIQVYLFIAPGLYQHERRAFVPYLVASPVLFVFGAAVVYFTLPVVLGVFASMQQTEADSVRIELLPKVSEYLDLIISLALAFGVTFQLPVALAIIARAGFINSETLRKRRRWAILGAFIVAAILTPPDPISQIALAIPTVILYEISIWGVSLIERAPSDKNHEEH